MAQYEVKVKTVGFDYYIVEAKDAETARKQWSTGEFIANEVDTEDVVAVSGIFEDDGIEYDTEFEDENEYV